MDTDSDIVVRYSLPENFFIPDPGFAWDSFNIDLGQFARDMENSYTGSPYQDASLPIEAREALKIVAKGLDGLDVLVKGIAAALKLVPGVPATEVRRFEVLDSTLGHISLLLKTGAISEANAKAAVKDGLEVAFGEASDFALALAVGYMSNHVTELLPGYGKLIPFAAIIGTYIASQATDKVGEAVAAGVTEVVFAAIDLAINSSHWIPNGVAPISAITPDLYLHPSDSYISGEVGHYDFQGFHGPNSGLIYLDIAESTSGSGVGTLYQQYAGRVASESELGYWRDQIENHNSNLSIVRSSIINDQSSRSYLSSVIDSAFKNYGGQSASSSDVDYWISHLSQGESFGDMRSSIINSQIGYDKFIDMMNYIFNEYAGRAPTSVEIANYRAVTIANNNDFNSVRTDVVASQDGQLFIDTKIHSLMNTIYGRDTTASEFATFKNFITDGASFDALTASIIQWDAPYSQNSHVGRLTFGNTEENTGWDANWVDGFYPGQLDGLSLIMTYFNASLNRIILPANLVGGSFDQLDIHEVFTLDNSIDVIINGSNGVHFLLPDTTLAELNASNILFA